MMKFDHAFRGMDALEAASRASGRKIVTLQWNKEDILDVFASQFREGADLQFMDFAANPVWQQSISVVMADDVLVDGRSVGISSGRVFSFFYKAMISLALLEADHSAPGAQVEVLWGDIGSRQKKIRVTVTRFPFLDVPFNSDIDVKKLPE